MATSEQIKALVRAHWSDDPERFRTVALQVAAHEATQGHGIFAHELRAIVDNALRKEHRAVIVQYPPELQGLVRTEEPSTPLAALVLPNGLTDRIHRVIEEYVQRDKLRAHGLGPRRKLLLAGLPGTGKTLTARILAHELQLPLSVVQLDMLVTKYMGESPARLRQIFDLIAHSPAVYLFDEFDAIGGGRTLGDDVGEMRRVLNAFLQFIEQDRSDSLIVAATNSPELLDHALFRRFDDLLEYPLPGPEERRRLVSNALGVFLDKRFGFATVIKASTGLSGAEIVLACCDAMKAAILSDSSHVAARALVPFLHERHEVRRR
ncbi:MAG: ATP-binding protein [Bacteroidetes bacterium]|nr:ATP-binding protein [Bacteroidota bacterium]